ncbi:hypothetical protein ABZ801_41460 [Actinomadura sp. NPDC047616]|uniref:hypothetical protein n=1 Tax=Actinomadura sp. NPDC047616 TaxID=3155914 RepID=UPI0033F6C7D5
MISLAALTRIMRRRVPADTRPPRRSPDPIPYTGDPAEHPVNPRNMHAWQCGCPACAMFWDSRDGAREYRAWRTFGGGQ